MRLIARAILFGSLLIIATPLLATQPSNYFEADGCDVMVFLQPLPSGDHTGSWLMQSIFSGETYTLTYDQRDVLTELAADGLSGRQISYINWRLIELHAEGTNRTETRWDLSQPVWAFSFDGEIIRGNRYDHGGVGGYGTYDPVTNEAVWTEVEQVFCGKRGHGDDH